jgi:hypothetical protein
MKFKSVGINVAGKFLGISQTKMRRGYFSESFLRERGKGRNLESKLQNIIMFVVSRLSNCNMGDEMLSSRSYRAHGEDAKARMEIKCCMAIRPRFSGDVLLGHRPETPAATCHESCTIELAARERSCEVVLSKDPQLRITE